MTHCQLEQARESRSSIKSITMDARIEFCTALEGQCPRNGQEDSSQFQQCPDDNFTEGIVFPSPKRMSTGSKRSSKVPSTSRGTSDVFGPGSCAMAHT